MVKSPILRFWSKVNKNGPISELRPDLGPCWLWKGCEHPYTHYGVMGVQGTPIRVHRFSYELVHGKIPNKLTIDHLCRIKLCVNPKHLEAVTRVENVMRGESFSAKNARKETCIKGHKFNKTIRIKRNGKIGPKRICLKCQSEATKRFLSKRVKGLCQCGIIVTQVKRWPGHVACRWHRGYRKALELRRRRVPFKEIGYQLGGLTPSYIARRLKALR